MKVVEILKNEHSLILDFLSILSKGLQRNPEEQGPSIEFYKKALSFSRNFLDKYHHYKEDYLLFGLLSRKKSILDFELDHLKSQHEKCRDLLNELAVALEKYSDNFNSATKTIQNILNEYIQILRSHINIEDNVVFPMLDHELTDDETQSLLKDFYRFEERAGINALETNRKLVIELTDMLK